MKVAETFVLALCATISLQSSLHQSKNADGVDIMNMSQPRRSFALFPWTVLKTKAMEFMVYNLLQHRLWLFCASYLKTNTPRPPTSSEHSHQRKWLKLSDFCTVYNSPQVVKSTRLCSVCVTFRMLYQSVCESELSASWTGQIAVSRIAYNLCWNQTMSNRRFFASKWQTSENSQDTVYELPFVVWKKPVSGCSLQFISKLTLYCAC